MNIHAHSESGQTPLPPAERGPWILAVLVAVLGVGVLVAVLTGLVGSSREAPAAVPPAVLAAAPTPTRALGASERAARRRGNPAVGSARHISARDARLRFHKQIVDSPTGSSPREDIFHFQTEGPTHIFERWVQGFYPIYEGAQRTFDVNWLLIASIHKQETAFSTAATTYHGLNFAHCCGGPMQFNVTNGPVTTWGLVRNAYRYGVRPAVYDHMTARHPSIYDDFDSVMAAAWLLSANGARFELNNAAWWAAYDYYGHDANGVAYADEVLARAIGWSQHGFCINCEVDQALVSDVYEAYGAPVLASLQASTAQASSRASRRSRSARARRRAKRTAGL